MFTGIVQDIGIVRSVEKNADLRVRIETALDLSKTAIGASICCSGCCLSIVEKGAHDFAVDISAETLSKTQIGQWSAGTKINLEPSLKLGDEMGGHIVSGHVDGLAEILEIVPDGASHRFRFAPPSVLMRYIAAKGSVCLDGVSLTVNAVGRDYFEVNIIPHTAENTVFGLKKPGDFLHMEVDMLARYVARMMEAG
ncbi:MAG: riboflavin synthase [Alphaproteobacteria bacterium]|nr:riboflavin synthase [Alphaproteobacteria bacterium]